MLLTAVKLVEYKKTRSLTEDILLSEYLVILVVADLYASRHSVDVLSEVVVEKKCLSLD